MYRGLVLKRLEEGDHWEECAVCHNPEFGNIAEGAAWLVMVDGGGDDGVVCDECVERLSPSLHVAQGAANATEHILSQRGRANEREPWE